MSILSRFDIRTLLACQMVLSAVFAVVFVSMKLAYRKMHGLGCIAIGFLCGVPGVLLLTLRGSISDFASIVIANSFVLGAFFFFYAGVLRFFPAKGKSRLPLVWTAALTVLATIAVIAWYSTVQQNIVPRIIASALGCGLLCVLIAIELLRHADGRFAPRLFASLLFLHTATNIGRIVMTLGSGTPANFMHPNQVQAFTMMANLIFLSFLGMFFQIMVAGELTQALEHSARHDLLTGTLNRLGIEERLTTELDRASRNRHPLSAVLIDIDRFKSINDTGGHAAGDAALRAVAQGIARSLRSYDLLGRYGGDEFLLLLPETSATHALDVVGRVRNLLAASGRAVEPALQPTISIGLAEIEPGDTAITLIARADAALYDAKHAGRNCVRHRSGMRQAMSEELLSHPLLAASFKQPEASLQTQ